MYKQYVKKLASAYAGDKYSQALTENIEKELKALEIIKKKNVDVFFLRNNCDTVEEYNKEINNNTMHYCYGNCRELTQEKFDLLKEVLGE